ncbi:hypothetical protein SAMN05192561_11214 [Halopenitus malekzadehii]|uniref:Uncharacterized protein n=1 Tax=Halopenitus malekzadehii TaxID=1267564 RepID=A0A1H6JNE6_9EURY|nr:hypothetical protein [Halopenitus malekzadehii]SEH60558.1 hypothetical protein SAMN05192561_11214 [Halopenitus malekzadehii]
MTHDPEQHERLAEGGFARLEDEDDEDTDTYSARVIPIGEGDITTGASGKKTYWSPEALRQGVEDGAFDGAKILKGRPGDGHKGMLDQADPDNIVGSVDNFAYEDGVGPVSEDADLLDEHIAQLVDHGLIDVSPDMFRKLGEYDEELGAYPVEKIIDVPYLTLLDNGASPSATIEPAMAEALGFNGRAEAAEQLAKLFTLTFNAYGEMFGDEFLDEAVENLEAIEGVSATRSSTNTDPELQATIDREAVASLDTLNDQIIDALEDTPFEVHESYDWIDDVAWEGLGEAGGSGQASDEPAESGTGTGGSSTHMGNNNDDLQEQLAEVRTERNQLEDETEDLQEQLAEKEEEIDDYEETVEQLKEERDELEEEVEPLVEMLADLAAEDSKLSADKIADRFQAGELVEMLAEDAGWSDEDDESPVEVVREQLAGTPNPRGEGGDSNGQTPSDEDLERAEQLAGGVLTASERLEVNSADVSEVEYLRQEYDVDATEFDTESELRDAIRGGA